MGAVDHTKAGIASGVVNASRQIGGALGVAVLGAVVSHPRSTTCGHGPPAQLVPLVTGGQGSKVLRGGDQPGPLAGVRTAPRPGAAVAFVHGVQGAMLVGAVLAFSAAMTAFFGLRHAPAAAQAPDACRRAYREGWHGPRARRLALEATLRGVARRTNLTLLASAGWLRSRPACWRSGLGRERRAWSCSWAHGAAGFAVLLLVRWKVPVAAARHPPCAARPGRGAGDWRRGGGDAGHRHRARAGRWRRSGR